MKTRFILAAMLLMAFGNVKAQEKLIPTPDGDATRINTLVINCPGSVYLQQGEKLMLNDYGHLNVNYHVEDSVLYLEGSGTPREVTLPNLTYLKILSSAGVRSKGKLSGRNLSIIHSGFHDLRLEVNYDNVYVCLKGNGNVTLSGDCYVFCGEAPKSFGKINTNDLKYMVKIEKSGDQWNMAFNTNADHDLKTDYLKEMVKNAQPFFDAEANRARESNNDAMQQNADDPEMARLSDIMAELSENMQQLSDSVDWEQFERDMEKWAEKMERWGEHVEKWGNRMERLGGRSDNRYMPPMPPARPEKPEPKETPKKRSLLMNPHWTGVDAGLNLLLGMGTNASFGDDNAFLELRPLRSWVFNFNIADVGIAFDRRHRVGLTTGIGLGWNNYSFNRPVRLIKGEQVLEHEALTEQVKKSKLGVLYVQAPLMLEVRPSGSSFFALGVTGGIRIDTWTKIKFQDGVKEKKHSDYYVNLLKLDATLRAGSDNLGFFASYNLLPLFVESHGPAVHTLNVGFSLIF